MKLTTKLLLLGIVGVAAAPFILKKPDGTPWLSLEEITSSAKQTATQAVEKAIPRPAQKMYRWQDSQGKWHYSDQPSDQFTSRKVELDSAFNEMKQINLPDGFGGGEKEEAGKFDPASTGNGLPITTAPLEKVPEMLKEIERVQEKMDQRQKQLDSL